METMMDVDVQFAVVALSVVGILVLFSVLKSLLKQETVEKKCNSIEVKSFNGSSLKEMKVVPIQVQPSILPEFREEGRYVYEGIFGEDNR